MKIVEVAAGILLRETPSGMQFLLARRPEDKVYAGYWEFPGGKVEPGETSLEALSRELKEEMGIGVTEAYPWLSLQYTYPHATVRLKFFKVLAWQGEALPLEHTGVEWINLGSSIEVSPVLPANGPILRALELPDTYVILSLSETPPETLLAGFKNQLDHGIRLFQIQSHDEGDFSPERILFIKELLEITRAYPQAILLINDNLSVAQDACLPGVQLSSKALMLSKERPDFDWVGATCHNEEELFKASSLGVDFVVLSMPNEGPEAWRNFAVLVEHLPFPVFADANMLYGNKEVAFQNGAQGIVLREGGVLFRRNQICSPSF